MRSLADASAINQSLLRQRTSARLERNQDGDLLERREFDLFITSDQNIRYQQNLAGRRIAILELSTNDLRRIEAARSLIEDAINELQPNEFKQLAIP